MRALHLLIGVFVRCLMRCCTCGGAGAMEWPRCTLPYAPPEVLIAVHDKCRAPVSAAQDMWSLGTYFRDAAIRHVFCVFDAIALQCMSYHWLLLALAAPPP